MKRGSNQFSRGGEISIRGFACFALLSAGLVMPYAVGAQTPAPRDAWASGSTDLSKENQSRVAASVEDIENALRANPGLMVELKRWVADDATEHGQLISDSDLTDLAIRERLEDDTKFRGVATRLLQRYGYLTPRLDPSSQLGRENELILEERIKRIAESGEACDPRMDAHCQKPVQSTRSRYRQSEESPEPPPDTSNPPPTPPGNPAPPNPSRVETTAERLAPDEDWENQVEPDVAFDSIPSDRSSLLPPHSEEGQREGGQTRRGERAGGTQTLISARERDARRLQDVEASSVQPDREPPEQARAEEGIRQMPPEESAGEPTSHTIAGETTRDGEFNSAGMIPAPEPYTGIAALREMYMQATAEPAAPRRFGMEVFENRTQKTQSVPMDLPVGPEYVVGPGDALAIDLWGGVSQRVYRAVDPEGRISLPEVGPVLVSGKSLGEIQSSVQQVLRTQFRDVSADVSLARLRTVRVYVVGDVARPGAYDVSSLSTPLNAIFLAGGPTERGSLRVAEHFRGKQLVQDVDLYALLLHGMNSDLARLENGDTVLVPPIGAGVTVAGMVRRPAIYELRGEKNLAEVLDLAGGILPSAALDHIEIERLVDHEKRTMVSLAVENAGGESAVRKQLESFAVHDKDIIRLFPIASYNQEAVYLEGHVLRPGRYAYRDGMKFTDLVAGYRDLMPEPAGQFAEIVHLSPPDYQPRAESFNLGDVLANRAASPALKPMDTIRIFSRYDFESVPSVSVWGEVRRPGTYRALGEMHVSDAVHVAGGLTPDALVGAAQVYRTLPDSTLKVFSVDLEKAAAGDPGANILLDPRDRIVVHRNLAKVDPPSVYVKGEIASPGRYPLTEGMRVSDLIRAGGGLRLSADADVANLTEFRITDSEQVIGDERSVNLAGALGGDDKSNVALRDGDTLTIRKITGWDDRGAAISVRGEVLHPGTFGFQPGERLSSVLERAGGFGPNAYPYGAVLERQDVRDQDERNQRSLILRVQEEQQSLNQLPDGDTTQKAAKVAALAQWQHILNNLESNPPIGRLVIHISANIRAWRNTPEDVPVRGGDVLIVPKAPNFVLVSGQVYNPTAVAYRPGRNARWYLSQSGGPTHIADKKAVFVVRADGAVESGQGPESLWKGDPLRAPLRPGDTVVVPEKAMGRSVSWQTVFLAGQVASSVVSAAFIAARY